MIRLRVCGCVRVCVCVLEPHVTAFVFIALLAAAAVSCRLYHTIPQTLKLSTLWQQWYNSSRTASLCDLYLPYVCAVKHVRVYYGVCGSLICVLEPTSQLLAFLFSLLLAAVAASCRIICVSHTVQQQSHSKFVWTSSTRLLIAYICMCVVCAMIRKHVACATAVMFEVNNTLFSRSSFVLLLLFV